ncbi:MAG: glycosyl transferase [Betaproteobacteria bacterium]|nr:glycosyl transferase [Betaproteobacteria bacterium]
MTAVLHGAEHATASPEAASSPRITVSVVSHGHGAMIASLLGQLAGLRNPDIARVIVVHNLPDADASTPEGAGFELIQLHNAKPKGFSANHNMAFAHCSTPWFAVLNPDLEFQFGDPFPALLAAGDADPKLGAVAPALVQPGTLHVEPNRGVVTPLELIRRRLPGWKPPAEPAWLVGAFLLIRTDVYRALGGFDERFWLYCEDVDFGCRVRQGGWAIRRLESVNVIHMTERRSKRHLKFTIWHVKSLLLLWRKPLLAIYKYYWCHGRSYS